MTARATPPTAGKGANGKGRRPGRPIVAGRTPSAKAKASPRPMPRPEARPAPSPRAEAPTQLALPVGEIIDENADGSGEENKGCPKEPEVDRMVDQVEGR